MPDPTLYLPRDMAGPFASNAAVWGFGVAALGALLVTAVALEARHRRRAAAAREALRTGRVTRDGHVAVFGRIEADPNDQGEGPVLAVRIEQVDTNPLDPAKPRWVEVRRAVAARPFYLVTRAGTRVRVEPDARAVFAEQLREPVHVGPQRRVREAEARVGDELYVVGEATLGYDASGDGAGYRGGARSVVLRAPRNKPLVLSREQPADRHARREGFHGSWAIASAAVMALLHLGLFAQYHLLNATGAVVWAPNAEVHERLVRRVPSLRARYDRRYTVVARMPLNERGAPRLVRDRERGELQVDPRESALGEQLLVSPTSAAVYYGVQEGYTRVPFLVSMRAPNVHQVGRHAVVSHARVALTGLVTALLALAYLVRTAATRPWYDRRVLVERR